MSKPRQILLLFLLGIGLPSLLLGYLAFRGIRNDQALLEKQRVAEQRQLAEQITRTLDEKLTAVEQFFITTLADSDELQGPELLQLLASLKSAQPVIEEVFRLDSSENAPPGLAKLPSSFEGKARSSSADPLPASWLAQRYAGEELEFQKQNYHEALTHYQLALAEGTSDPMKGEALVAIARVQRKSNRLPEAIQAYRTIAKDHHETWTASGLPLGLAARLELGGLLCEGQARSHGPTTTAREEVTTAFTERRAFHGRRALEIGGQEYLICVPSKPSPRKQPGNPEWGFLLNVEHFQAVLLQPAIQQYAAAAGTAWVVRGQKGETIAKSALAATGPISARQPFAGGFPPWELQFHQPASGFYETLLTSRRGVYLYAFVLLAGILVFGLTLTSRSMTRELELAKMKSDFVATVSHEFKSPLTAIRQLAEMLQAGRVPSEQRRQDYYNVLVEQSERLTRLIDNILDFARMEEGRKQFAFEPVELAKLLEKIVADFQQRVRHTGFAVHLKIAEPLPAITADRAALTQVISNLLDNAVKYSGDSRQVIVSALAEPQHLVITVQDFGLGIGQDEIERVFERFYRGGDTLTRSVKGSGLGLTLVKQIVATHGGTVQVESEPGRGSTFSIRLPVNATKT